MFETFIGFFVFTAFLFFACFVPGWVIARRLNLLFEGWIERLVVSVILGLSVFTLIAFVSGFIGLRFIPFVFVVLGFILFLRELQRGTPLFIRSHFMLWHYLLGVLIFLGTVGQGLMIFLSGWVQKDGSLVFTEYRDAMWHFGLINQLVERVPPLHPGFTPELVTHYHYFYDLFVAEMIRFTRLPLLDIYFHYMPIFMSVFLGLSVYLLSCRMFHRSGVSLFAVFLTYFCGSLGFLVPYFFPQAQGWGDSSFWVAQTYAMHINPPFSISLILFLVGSYCLNQFLSTKRRGWIVAAVLLFGPLIAFKVYAGIVMLAGLFTLFVWMALVRKDTSGFPLFVGVFVLSLVVFLPTNGFDAGGFLIFAPGWYLRAMVENPDRLYHLDWVLREEHYLFFGNYLRIFQLRFYEFLIFLVGNLNVRIIGLFGLLYLLIVRRFSLRPIHVFMIGASAAAFGMPMLFIQRGSVANSIQFFYYFLVILNIYTAAVIFRVIRTRFLLGIVLVVLALLALPTSIKMGYDNLFTLPRTVISRGEMDALYYLRTNLGNDKIIAVSPTFRHTLSMYVAGLSGRRTFYSDRAESENTQRDYKSREADLTKLFWGNDWSWSQEFLIKNGITHLYVRRDDNVVDFEKHLKIIKQFTNNEVTIYEVMR